MLSGIGPSVELQGVGITPVVDAPQVGGNLTVSYVFYSGCVEISILIE